MVERLNGIEEVWGSNPHGSKPRVQLVTIPRAISLRIGLPIATAASLASPCVAADPVFEKDVKPAFRESCTACHGPEKSKGGFRADSRKAVVESGHDGPWVVPGNADESKLVQLLTGAIRTKKAADKHALPDAQIEKIRAWIDAGAK